MSLYQLYKRAYYRNLKDIRGFTRFNNFVDERKINKIERVTSGTSIFDLEWDNLIIIDACRHDLYEEVNGTTDFRYTLGSTTREYVERNFRGRVCEDIVYVSANPFLSEKFLKENISQKNPFHEKYDTFKTDWSEEGTVLPKSVVRDARSAEKLFGDKRKIIHFLQPHYPFVNSNISEDNFNSNNAWFNRDFLSAWERAEMGELSPGEIWDAYRSNLEYVMSSVGEVAEFLEGRTIVTSDHGNLVGEKGLYGHPKGSSAKPLRKVPLEVIK